MEKRIPGNIEEARRLTNIAITTGQMLVKNGAEIYRAEDTIERMVLSREIVQEVDVFALSSAIFVSAEYRGESITMLKDIKSYGVNLAKIDALNAFSRHFVAGDIPLDEAHNELLAISQMPARKPLVSMFFTGLCSASFAVMFGGTWYDFAYTFFIGAMLNGCLRLTGEHNLSFFAEVFIGTLVVSILALFGSYFFPRLHMDMLIIGSIMPLVPGMVITNSFRDIISGDYVSGLIGITKGIFVALTIALGVGVILNIQKMFMLGG
ncbi:MAG: threonine/serine exporter family protein [Peptoniphilus sp.]|nr:threonine/serine exporter family protein [Peptoniphilus sp.]MDD7363339.1 threonine/serine exporter family protein [Bacillota bacterium]MDY6044258.1 threonine/serine exporter family protein [Peptoniphilus sp.]